MVVALLLYQKESEDYIMWITRKQMNKIIDSKVEKELQRVESKHQSEMVSKQLEISRLKNELAMKDLKMAVMNLELKVCDWSNHWGLDTVESEDK